ncbi:MAG: N-acetylneuraminate synthase family protein [Lachnospiraceae bacterium]|jgi:N-acetylneuraminate synthase|nr:N-acetylneuraminate synthase family protein [Lachnospiraceae bacterium]
MKIGKQEIGKGSPVFVIAEIGINHNGDLETAKKLIVAAKQAGCDAVKLQKRTIDVVYTREELAAPRETPFGKTNGDLKRGLEFSQEDYREIDRLCKETDILWSASPWDEASADFLAGFDVPFYKIAAASLTDAGLLKKVKAYGKPVILSTGMSELSEIDKAVALLDKENLLLLHCVSQYPAEPENIHLRVIDTLRERYNVPVGYSGHEMDTFISVAAVAMGACAVERHFTLSRSMWGSDQKASIEPDEMAELVKSIRIVEQAMGESVPRCLPVEVPVKNKLRRVESL